MARLIIWSRRAIEDLEAIAAYIAQDSETYAASVVRTILQKVRFLTEFPYIGRVVPEFDDQSGRYSLTVTGSYIRSTRQMSP